VSCVWHVACIGKRNSAILVGRSHGVIPQLVGGMILKWMSGNGCEVVKCIGLILDWKETCVYSDESLYSI